MGSKLKKEEERQMCSDGNYQCKMYLSKFEMVIVKNLSFISKNCQMYLKKIKSAGVVVGVSSGGNCRVDPPRPEPLPQQDTTICFLIPF